MLQYPWFTHDWIAPGQRVERTGGRFVDGRRLKALTLRVVVVVKVKDLASVKMKVSARHAMEMIAESALFYDSTLSGAFVDRVLQHFAVPAVQEILQTFRGELG